MGRIDRAQRTRIQRRAHEIRQRGQLGGWDVAAIAAAILAELPAVSSLEAWRLAYGWSRPHVLAGIAALYRADGLAEPALNAPMLCRWEHGGARPGPEYAKALCRLYAAQPAQLGLSWPGGETADVVVPAPRASDAADEVSAVWESVRLALAVEGAAGGPLTREQLGQAARFYALNYSAVAPARLTAEVRRARTTAAAMLGTTVTTPVRRELLSLVARLSALLGNLAFHQSDDTAARIHLQTACGLAADVGHRDLHAWSLGARAMLARRQHRPAAALALARGALRAATTPLRRAQAIAWAEVPALVALARHDEARTAITTARHEFDAATDVPGRFGFDRAEFALHLSEATLAMGDPATAAAHAATSVDHSPEGRPSWVAATLTLARAEAALGHADHAAELGLQVLDTTHHLRAPSHRRLTRLATALTDTGTAADLLDRLHTVGLG